MAELQIKFQELHMSLGCSPLHIQKPLSQTYPDLGPLQTHNTLKPKSDFSWLSLTFSFLTKSMGIPVRESWVEMAD